MSRPDIPGGDYGGWQVIDATPQEPSAGEYSHADHDDDDDNDDDNHCEHQTTRPPPPPPPPLQLPTASLASEAEDPGFESRLRRDFSWSSHTSDSKTGTPVATLLDAWRSRVSAGTGRPGVSILTG